MIWGMETAPRPAVGTPVRVTFPGSLAFDPEMVVGVVVEHWLDGFDVGVVEPGPSHDAGELFTLFDSQLASGTTLEIL